MRHAAMDFVTVVLFAWTSAGAQIPASVQGEHLGTITIAQPVLAGGNPLPPATYELRLSPEPVAPRPGQSPDAQRRVDFVMNGMVVAREIAEVLHDDDIEPGRARVTRPGVRVELLKGGEFVRVSVRRGSERYLLHLPAAASSIPR